MTRILNEDLRDRTSRATDTTKFLTREVQKLQAENAALDAKIAQLQAFAGQAGCIRGSADQPLRCWLNSRPNWFRRARFIRISIRMIQSLKRQIEAMEKAAPPPASRLRILATSASLEALDSPARSACRKIWTWLRRSWRRRGLEKILRRISSQKSWRSSNSRRSRKSRSSRIGRKLPHLPFCWRLMAGPGLALLVEISDKGIRRSQRHFQHRRQQADCFDPLHRHDSRTAPAKTTHDSC